MSDKFFGGSIAVMTTPYLENHEIDLATMAQVAKRISDAGTNGIFVSGSTGDMPLLGIKDRVELVKATRPAISDQTVLYAGISDYSIQNNIENAKRFADAGADAAVLMAPTIFFLISQPEVTEYFRQIADESPIPIVLYHHMCVTTPISLETVRQVMDHPNIIGMKETGSTFERTQEILTFSKGHDFFLLQGREAFLEDSYRLGALGSVAALAVPCPEPFLELDRAWRAKDQEKFKKYLKEVDELCEIFDMIPETSFSYFTYTIKRMLEYRGWADNSFVRFPGFDPDPEFDKRLHEKLESLNFPKE